MIALSSHNEKVIKLAQFALKAANCITSNGLMERTFRAIKLKHTLKQNRLSRKKLKMLRCIWNLTLFYFMYIAFIYHFIFSSPSYDYCVAMYLFTFKILSSSNSNTSSKTSKNTMNKKNAYFLITSLSKFLFCAQRKQLTFSAFWWDENRC